MTFQDFFFDTYLGCFLQVLPIALIAGALYGLFCYAGDRDTSKMRKLLSITFVCYIVALICLVCFFEGISTLWYKLLYPNGSGLVLKTYTLHRGANFIPDSLLRMNGEKLANILMFMPFGFLFPFFIGSATWKNTVFFGFLFSIFIEAIQPLCNRFFDINDIIMNTLGVIISATIFFQCFEVVCDGRSREHKSISR